MKKIIKETNNYIIYIEKSKLAHIKSIKCKKCGKVSYNQDDVNKKYCGNCDIFHDLKFKIGNEEFPVKKRHTKYKIKENKGKNFLIIFIIMFFISLKSAFACPQGQHKIIKIIDGDTFDIKEGRIRLLGVDAYDTFSKKMIKRQKVRTNDIFSGDIIEKGKVATSFAENTILNRCVILENDYKDRDIYGRLLRYININGADFGALLLDRGLGNVYCGDKKIERFNRYNELSEFRCK